SCGGYVKRGRMVVNHVYGSVLGQLLFCLSLLAALQPIALFSPYTTLFRSATESPRARSNRPRREARRTPPTRARDAACAVARGRSEEHTSELQSRENLVCRLLLDKKKGEGGRQQCSLPTAFLHQVTMSLHT